VCRSAPSIVWGNLCPQTPASEGHLREAWLCRNPKELVRHARPSPEFRGGCRNLCSASCRTVDMDVPVALVRPRHSAPPPPLLSVLCLRWFDYWSDCQWSDYTVTSDTMLSDLFLGPLSVREQLAGEYEVCSVFVKTGNDLLGLDPHWLRGRLRGKRVVTWNLLWPVMTASAGRYDGCVGEREFFSCCARMERARLRSAWPHPSHLYRVLCGKMWIPQMCLSTQHRVPPTTRVHFAEFQRSGKRVARRALDHLMVLRSRLWSKAPVPLNEFQGVVKLGFSWCGGDVLPFMGLESLCANIERLFTQPGCEQLICLVQERVLGVVGEHRVVCFHDARLKCHRKEALWILNMKPTHFVHRCDPGDFEVASSTVVSESKVDEMLFGGDGVARRMAEEEARTLVDHWLLWYLCECPEPPQCTRIDFLVSHVGPGQCEVWTCEVGECGASLCSLDVHGRNAAVVNSAVGTDGVRFPSLLPTRLPRHLSFECM